MQRNDSEYMGPRMKMKTSEYVVNEDMHKVISDLDLDRTPLLTLNVDLMSSYISQEVDVRLCGR